jgi:anti-sigma28 factor (negative regulator of flagellin synthesis)
MNDIFLDPNSRKHLISGSKETVIPPQKSSQGETDKDISFREVLKGVTGKKVSSPEIRRDLVEKYKTSLAEGTYEIKAHELAEKMIQKIRESQTRVII